MGIDWFRVATLGCVFLGILASWALVIGGLWLLCRAVWP